MHRTAVLTAVAALVPVSLLPVSALAQSSPSHLEFEVASIRPSPPIDASVKVGMHTDGAMVRFEALSLRDCMRIAWAVKDFQIIGPDWIASDRFNISAKVPEGGGANEDQRREMLRNLLQERFKLTFHNEKKEFAVYALELGKNGLKMKETVVDPAAESAAPAKGLNISGGGSAAGVYVDLGGGSFYSFADNKLVGHKLAMSRISDTLAAYMDKPVVNMTGLPDTKVYDFTLEITPDDYRVMLIRSAIRAGVTLPPEALRLADGSIDSFYSALDLVGLKMTPRRAPLDVMVIDHADKSPAEN
jgi:uncharacterized protein (TIGR03435 family)